MIDKWQNLLSNATKMHLHSQLLLTNPNQQQTDPAIEEAAFDRFTHQSGHYAMRRRNIIF